MSASTERKNRLAAREAGTDKKMLAQQAEEQKKAKSKRQWTIGTIIVVVALALIILVQTPLVYTATTAVSAGNRNYSPAEVNYFVANEYQNFANQYGSYASIFGLDTSRGVAGLKSQPCPMMDEGQTWYDYFLQSAQNSMQQIAALNAYAKENGIALDADELTAINDGMEDLSTYAAAYGYSSANRFLRANYGNGVTTKLIKALTAESRLAAKVLDEYGDSLEYTDAELEEYYSSLNGANDYFSFVLYSVAAEKTETTDADGNTTSAATDESRAAAKATAEEILKAFQAGEVEDLTERLTAAVTASGVDGEASLRENVLGSSLGAYEEFLAGSRKVGDAEVIEGSDGDTFSVVVYVAREDNHYPTVAVRHILIQAQPSEDGTYTEEAKAEALAKIEDIKAEFEAGDKTEESFAALAEQYSEDTGSNTKGGLYENIYKNQMVKEFNDFCFEGHKAGDLGIAYGESSSYAGYHLIYFVGEGELYSNVLARNALVNQAVSEFTSAQSEGFEPTTHFWERLVG